MGVSVDKIGDVAVLVPDGNLWGGKETDALSKALKELQATDNKRLVLDLGKVQHVNSMGIGVLVGAHANYQKRGGRIVLANVDRRIENVFVITKLTLVFEVAGSREEALAALGA